MEAQRGGKSKKNSLGGDAPPKVTTVTVTHAAAHLADCGAQFNKNGRKLKGPDDYAAAHAEDLEVKVVLRRNRNAADSQELATPMRVLFCRFCQSEVTSKSNRISEHLQSVRHNRFKQGIQAGETWNALAAMYGAHSSSKLAAAGVGVGGNLQLDPSAGNGNTRGHVRGSVSVASSPSSSCANTASASISGTSRNGAPKHVKKSVDSLCKPTPTPTQTQTQTPTPPRNTNGVHTDAKQRRIEQFAFDVVQTCAYIGVSSSAVENDKALLVAAFAKYAPNCLPRASKLDAEESTKRWLPEIFAKHVEETRIRLKGHLLSLTVDDHDGLSSDYASTNVDVFVNVYDAVADEQRVYLLWSFALPLAQPATHAAQSLLDTVEIVLRLYDCEMAQVIALVTSCSVMMRHFAEVFLNKRPSCLHVPNIRTILQRTIYRALTCETELEVVFNLVKQTEQCFRHATGVRQAYLEACVAAGISPENVGVCWNVDGSKWQSWFSAAKSIHKSWSFLSAFLETFSSEQLAIGSLCSGEFTAKQFGELKACFTADEHRELIYLLLTAVIDALEPFRDVAQYLDEDLDLPFKVAYLLNTKLKRAADLPLSDRVLCMINVLSRTKQDRVLRIVNQFRSSLCIALEQEIERASVSANVFAVGAFFERCAVFDPVFKTLAQYSAEQSTQLLSTFEPYFNLLSNLSGYPLSSASQEFCEYIFSHPVQQCVVSLTQFWKSNLRKYPNLGSLALQLAAIPVATPLRKDELCKMKDRSNAVQFHPSSCTAMLGPLLKQTRDPESVIVRCLHENVAVFVESQKRANPLSIGTPTIRETVGCGLLSALEDMSKLCAANFGTTRIQLPTPPDQCNTNALNLSNKVPNGVSNVEPTLKRKRTLSPSPASQSPSNSSASINDYSVSDQPEINKNERNITPEMHSNADSVIGS